MDIHTRFNIGDKVWAIDPENFKAIEFEVKNVSIHINENGIAITYSDDPIYGASFDENRCFPTKELLLTSL